LRNQILLKKKLIEGERVEVVDDDSDGDDKLKEIVIEESEYNATPINIEPD
jgi:hypothetical protein